MKKLVGRFFREEEGSSLVLIAIGMAVLMGAAALVTDVGLIYLSKTRLTNAVDAAVLAGIQELPAKPAAARDVALRYAGLNGAEHETIEVIIGADNRSLTVKGKVTVNLFFAKILGFNSREVAAVSKGAIGAIKGMTGLLPLSIQEQDLVFGQEYSLKMGDGFNGWFGPVALGGKGASVYRTNLEQGYGGYLEIGDVIEIEPGNMSGPTKQGLDYRINNDPHYPKCTPENYQRSCPRVVYIPVVSEPSKGGRSTVTIKGFAAFLLADALIGNGTDSIVKGCFLQEITPGDIAAGTAGFGLNGAKLVE